MTKHQLYLLQDNHFELEGKLTQAAYDLIVPKYRKVTIDLSPEAMGELRKEKPNSPIEINIDDHTLVGNIKRRDYKRNRLHILAEVKDD